jgi:hypothetical protein
MKDTTGIVAAANVAKNGPYPSKGGSEDVLTVARSRMTMAISAYSETRESELDDLRFYAGSPDNQWQWPADVLQTRGAVQGQTINARPCLTINKLPQHVKQVTNDQRMNRPGIKVIPADDKGDIEMAEVYNGVIRHIEYTSDADVAYDTACENQVSYGEGYIRVLTEYCDESTFDQDIKIGRVRNSFSVYMDPLIQDPTGADARWCFITEDLTKAEYERLYPNAAPINTLMSLGVGDQSISQWISENTVRIAEYFYIEYEKATLNLYPGNVTAFDGTPDDKSLRLMFGKPLRSRPSDRKKVKWCKINGYEILEERDWAGSFIPVVRVVGNEFEVDGRIYVSGLVRNAKDAQRMYNYWASQEAEMLALAPKAPFIGYGGQFEGYEQQWKTANTQNWPYLEVNPDVTDGQGAVLPLPQRAQPPMASSGLLQAKAGASEDIKSATGQYNASLGMTSNERSGKAILARQREGDVGVYHYVDNLARAIRHVGRQLVDLIPKIYDTERIARIIGEDGESSTVKMNPMQEEPVKSTTLALVSTMCALLPVPVTPPSVKRRWRAWLNCCKVILNYGKWPVTCSSRTWTGPAPKTSPSDSKRRLTPRCWPMRITRPWLPPISRCRKWHSRCKPCTPCWQTCSRAWKPKNLKSRSSRPRLKRTKPKRSASAQCRPA